MPPFPLLAQAIPPQRPRDFTGGSVRNRRTWQEVEDVVDLNKGLGLWRQCRKCRRSRRRAFTRQHVSVVGGVAVFGGGTGDVWRMTGGVSVDDIGVWGKVEGGDRIPSFRCSQTHSDSHGGSRLPLMGGVQRVAMLEALDRSSGTIPRLAWEEARSSRSDTIIGRDRVKSA